MRIAAQCLVQLNWDVIWSPHIVKCRGLPMTVQSCWMRQPPDLHSLSVLQSWAEPWVLVVEG